MYVMSQLNLPPKNNQPIGPHKGEDFESLLVRIDLRHPGMAAAQACPQRLVFLQAAHVSAEELRAAFAEHDHISGSLRASDQIVLVQGGLIPTGVPALAPPTTPKAVMGLPPKGADGAEDAFFVAYRNALDAMLDRRDFGFRVTFYGPEVLCFLAHRDIPAGQVEFVVRGAWSEGRRAVASDPSEFPQRVLQDAMLLAKRFRTVLHWPERGLIPTYPEDERYLGPSLSAHIDLIEPGMLWPVALMDGCINAAEYVCVRPDSTLGVARKLGGRMEIVRLDPSRLMNGRGGQS